MTMGSRNNSNACIDPVDGTSGRPRYRRVVAACRGKCRKRTSNGKIPDTTEYSALTCNTAACYSAYCYSCRRLDGVSITGFTEHTHPESVQTLKRQTHIKEPYFDPDPLTRRDLPGECLSWLFDPYTEYSLNCWSGLPI